MPPLSNRERERERERDEGHNTSSEEKQRFARGDLWRVSVAVGRHGRRLVVGRSSEIDISHGQKSARNHVTNRLGICDSRFA